MTLTPTLFTDLTQCLKRMAATRTKHVARLRFILPDNSCFDIYYFTEDDTTRLYHRKRKSASVYVGQINPDAVFHASLSLPTTLLHTITPLLLKLSSDFTQTIHDHGIQSGTCVLCGSPLLDPTALKSGVTFNCIPHLTPPASLEDI